MRLARGRCWRTPSKRRRYGGTKAPPAEVTGADVPGAPTVLDIRVAGAQGATLTTLLR
jgi:hypothetical protein